MLSIDPENTRVALIGASTFEDRGLNPLPGVLRNISELRKILADPRISGIPVNNIVTFVNFKSPNDLAKELSKLARKASDTFIVYYSGHGKIGTDPPQLYLVLPETTAADFQFSALSIEWVRTALRQSGAQKRILILDCCYAGRGLGMMADTSSMIQSRLEMTGTYCIAAAPANEEAMAPPGEEYTAFTGELLRVLKEGIDNNKEGLSLRDIFERIRSELLARYLPEPQQMNVQDGENLVIAKNKRFDTQRFNAQGRIKGEKEKFFQLAVDSRLSPNLYSKAVKLIEADDASLNEQEKRIKALTREFLAGTLLVKDYANSVDLITGITGKLTPSMATTGDAQPTARGQAEEKQKAPQGWETGQKELTVAKGPVGVRPASAMVTFLDAKLESNIRQAIRKPSGDITTEDLEDLSSLFILNVNHRITSFEGLQHCTHLQDLVVSFGRIDDMSALSSLSSLKHLELSETKISDISPLSSLTDLTALHLDINNVSDISPLSSLTKLTYLSLDHNKISDISPLSSLANLTFLVISSNKISDVSPLSSLTQLKKLLSSHNQVTDISSLSSLVDLTDLSLDYNKICDISALSSLSKLREIQLENNQIVDVSPLLSISSLGDRVTIVLNENPLSATSRKSYVRQLKSKGVKVKLALL